MEVVCRQVHSRMALPSTSPEALALEFYLGNHAMAYLRGRYGLDEPLAGNHLLAMDHYLKSFPAIYTRLVDYLLLIITRETRHVRGGKFLTALGHSSPEYAKFLSSIRGLSSSDAVDAFFKETINLTLGEYLDNAYKVYMKGTFGKMYGGKAWGLITDTLRSMVVGITSPEAMVDTAFTLSHNTSAIFNKGMQFYKQTKSLIIVLDCQRAGQIPALLEGEDDGKDLVGLIYEEYTFYKHVLPEIFEDKLCWDKVVSLGAVGHYKNKVKGTAIGTGSGPNKHMIYIDHTAKALIVQR
jgi:hypothetical protein